MRRLTSEEWAKELGLTRSAIWKGVARVGGTRGVRREQRNGRRVYVYSEALIRKAFPNRLHGVLDEERHFITLVSELSGFSERMYAMEEQLAVLAMVVRSRAECGCGKAKAQEKNGNRAQPS